MDFQAGFRYRGNTGKIAEIEWFGADFRMIGRFGAIPSSGYLRLVEIYGLFRTNKDWANHGTLRFRHHVGQRRAL